MSRPVSLVVLLCGWSGVLANCNTNKGALVCSDPVGNYYNSSSLPSATSYSSVTLTTTSGVFVVPANYFADITSPNITIRCEADCTAIKFQGDIFKNRLHSGSVTIISDGEIHFLSGQVFHNVSGGMGITAIAAGLFHVGGSAFTALAGNAGSSFVGDITIRAGGDFTIGPGSDLLYDIAMGAQSSYAGAIRIVVGGNLEAKHGANFLDRLAGKRGSFAGSVAINVGGDFLSYRNVLCNVASNEDATFNAGISINVGGTFSGEDLFMYVGDNARTKISSDVEITVGSNMAIGDESFRRVADGENASFVGDVTIDVAGNLNTDELFTYLADSRGASVTGNISISVGGDWTSTYELFRRFADAPSSKYVGNVELNVAGSATISGTLMELVASDGGSYVGDWTLSVGKNLIFNGRAFLEIAHGPGNPDSLFRGNIGVFVGGSLIGHPKRDTDRLFQEVCNTTGVEFIGDFVVDIKGDLIAEYELMCSVGGGRGFAGEVTLGVCGSTVIKHLGSCGGNEPQSVVPGQCRTAAPTRSPTMAPSSSPTMAPSSSPTTKAPSSAPSAAPTTAPTSAPTAATMAPSSSPTTKAPSSAPSAAPTTAPTSTLTAAVSTAPSACTCTCLNAAERRDRSSFAYSLVAALLFSLYMNW